MLRCPLGLSKSLRLPTACQRNQWPALPWALSIHSSYVLSKESELLRVRLRTEFVSAFKAKDHFSANTLRAVLAEINDADKTSGVQVPNHDVVSILRKALTRRAQSAAQYKAASREDLAEKETQEANLLEKFLPPSLSEAEIDARLKECLQSIENSDSRAAMGRLMKAFYAQVDKSAVEGKIVKERAEHLLHSQVSA